VNPLVLSKLSEIRSLSLERVSSLRATAASAKPLEPSWMSHALQELDVAHEVLRVVEEELHAQSEELTAAYGALEYERRRYRSLFEGAPVPYLVTDCSGIVLEANRFACKLLNIEASFIVGKPLTIYVAGDDRRLMREVLGVIVSTDEVTSFDIRLWPRRASTPTNVSVTVRRTAGQGTELQSLRWILQAMRPAPSDGASQFCAASAPSNRIEDTRDESALEPRGSTQAGREALERELADERMRRGTAELALTRRNEQLAYVAHELRNPINAATGWLELLASTDSAATRERALQVLSRNLKVIAHMVNELVDQTRVVRELVLLDWYDTDFRALIDRVCQDALGLAHSKRLSFQYEVDPRIGLVRCDAQRIQQALSNIVSNAIKFTPAGGSVLLTAALRGAELGCEVRDSGPGIAAENLQTIFEPYMRIDATGASTGLGLGLHIARKLVELHGGSIAAESKGLGHGATFRIRLPVNGLRSEG
jgi:PAS domain S-box-containing protein